MRTMGLFAALLAAAMAAPPALGQGSASLTPEDFAYGFNVVPEGSGPLWELSLPDELYRSVYRPDLGDVRVFNGAGIPVPHEIAFARASQTEREPPLTLPVFPVFGETSTQGRIRIVTDAQGAIIEATTDSSAPRVGGAGEHVVSYLVDLGLSSGRPEQLELQWGESPGRGFAAALDVASSDDLATWQTRVSGFTVADLRSGDAELLNRTIDLPTFDDRYLRIEWPETLREVPLEGVQIFFAATPQPLDRRSLTVLGMRQVFEDDRVGYFFDTGGYWPVDRVRVVLQESNVVRSGTLLSRGSEGEDWRVRYSGTWYRLEQDGTQVSSQMAPVDVSSDRLWLFDPGEEQDPGGEVPRLEVGWVPHRLTFVAQGDPPFTVAFGSARVEATGDRALRSLVANSGAETGRLISSATASDVFTLGGAARLQPPEPAFPWRLWVLWAVLGSGVVLLTWMVVRLVRQMRQPSG